MKDKKPRAADESIELMYWGVRVFTSGPDAVLAERGLGRVHHRVIYCVARSPRIRIGELAGLLGISRQALHRPLRELVDRDLLRSERSEDNARERELTLTEEALELERRLSAEQRRLLTQAERAVGADAMEGWRAIMRFIARPGVESAPTSLAHHLAHLLPADTTPSAKTERSSGEVRKRRRAAD